MKTVKGFAAALLLALLVAIHAGGAQLANLDSPLTEASPAYSSSKVQAALKEVLPMVEDVTGRKLKRIPPIKLVTRKEYMTSTMKDRKQQAPQSTRTNRQKETKAQPRAQTYIDYALGIYEPRSNVVYLLPGNFRPRLERAGVPRKYDDAILKMVVAHELTHALQNQEVWSAGSRERQRNRRSTRSYSPTVIRALNEGHATFVMDMVAEKLGFPDAIPQFHKTISAGLMAYTDPEQQKANEEFRDKMRSFYLDGKRFIEWHYERGGKERVWQIMKNPPTDWSVIENPETLGAHHDRLQVR